ncbi:MAG: YraN family protein [Robiginitomaculum sp.]|nr:YraN family protein [Robiginitomaculum sp.]
MSRISKRRAERSGRFGEIIAIFWLQLQGYRICKIRYKTPVGEIDLIAKRGKWLVFVEVKWRKSGASAFDVSPHQANRIVRAAELYLASQAVSNHVETRFDILLLGSWRWPRHITGAFDADNWVNR